MKLTQFPIVLFALLILLSVQVPAQSLAYDPASLDYGEVHIGDSDSMSLVINSMGPDLLIVKNIAVIDDETGSFEMTLVTNNGEKFLPPYHFGVPVGNQVQIDVTFAPFVEGIATAQIYVLSNATNIPNLYIPLQGEGVTPDLEETSVLVRADIRVSPTTAPLVHRTNPVGGKKMITLTIWTGSLFLFNEKTHIWLMGDGYMDTGNPATALQGRGIIFGHSSSCNGVSFEHFGVNAGFPDPCISVDLEDFEFYDISLSVLPDEMIVRINGPGVLDEALISFPTDYPSFDTIMGVCGDKMPASYAVFNLLQTITDME